MAPSAPNDKNSSNALSFIEFILIVAALMALNALAIDTMLPALPQMGEALNVIHENDRQLIITAYLIGMAAASLLFGPLSDAVGRRKLLIIGLLIYSLGGILSIFATDYEHMLAARVLQGIGAASPRVLTISMVRDWYSGRDMGRVMSLAMMIFMAVPIIAPSIGQLILLMAPWRAIFIVLTSFGVLLLIWLQFRLPESLPPEKRNKFNLKTIYYAYKKVIVTPISFGYMLAISLIMGALFGFINSIQQIMVDIFDMGKAFPIIFAGIAVTMSLAAYLNATLVRKIGMRKLAHGALLMFTLCALINSFLAYSGHQTIVTFVILQALTMFFFGFVGSNCNAMAMDPIGDIAGTASSLIVFFTTLVGALIGAAIGASFNDTTIPLTLGSAVLGSLAVIVVYFTEGQRLFTPKHDDD
ncbi:multidrug effflux MFS transporter [Polycladidibacter stylochi]|uniref:multidrug effflux MFS transporter n=1 Tax=Polycladidibacter stylochi TaxID=1807766 RepID=UPI00082F1EB7|nr:multidrug effflux MFS transporter [Pseudovibrio stylochi]